MYKSNSLFFDWLTGKIQYTDFNMDLIYGEELSTRVHTLIKIVSLARRARKNANIKMRQPLAQCIVVPANNIEYEALIMFAKDFIEELNIKNLTIHWKDTILEIDKE